MEKTKNREKQCVKFYEPINSSVLDTECSDIINGRIFDISIGLLNFNEEQLNYGSIN